MNIVYRDPAELIPYEKNTKKHNKKQVDNVAASINQYGFIQPVVIDKDGVIVIGHCRVKAAKKLKLDEIPCVCVDELTEEQVKALRIVDNKTNESAWDFDILKDEIATIPEDILADFNFSLNFTVGEKHDQQHEENLIEAQNRRENILQFAKGQYYGDNPFDIPELEPVYEIPEIEEWIDFDYVLREKNPEHKAVHFFCDDYKFERIWKQPEKYIEKLSQFVCVATPDFSPYGDMPLICQMFNHYRKHWVGAYLQEHGVTVIPTIRCSTDERFLDRYLDGEPHGGIVIISSMWTKNEGLKDINDRVYEQMKETLHPCKIFIYGGAGNMNIKDTDNVEFIENFTQKRWSKNG